MPTIITQNELFRRAVAYIGDQRRDHPEKSLHDVLDAAAMRFNLTPADYETLLRLLTEKTAAGHEVSRP